MILGDRVMVEEVKSQMMGQPFTGHGMSGYDNVSDKYWATWIDSMSTGVMTSEGTCDANMACTYTGSLLSSGNLLLFRVQLFIHSLLLLFPRLLGI